MKHLVSAFLFLCASLAWSQSATTGAINSSGSTCPINTQASNCVVLQLPAFSSTVGVSILGTYSATLQFEVSADFGASWVNATAIPQPVAAGVTSATSTGTWQVNVAGMSHIRIRGSAYTSGTANISLAAASGIGLSPSVPSTGASSSAVQGAGASGSAVSGNPVLVAGSDGTSARTIGTDNAGNVSVLHGTNSADGFSNALSGGLMAISTNPTNGFAPLVVPYDFNASTWDRHYKCNQTALISVSSATTTSLVATSASTKIHVCAWLVTGAGAAASTAQFEFGTGAACVTTQAPITAAMPTSTATVAIPLGQSGLTWESAAAAALCFVSTGTGAQTGYVAFSQY